MIRLLVFLIFMLCSTGLVYLVFVHELPRIEEESSLPQPTADVAMREIHIRQNRGAELEWEAFADGATYNENNRQAWLTTVRFQLFRVSPESTEPADIRGVADMAFVDDVRKRVMLQGKVHITKDAETEVRADAIDYYTVEGVVRARGNVEVRDKKSYMRGDSMVYTISTDRVIVTTPKLYQ